MQKNIVFSFICCCVAVELVYNQIQQINLLSHKENQMQIATTFASRALQAGGRIMAAYPKFSPSIEPGSPEHFAQFDLAAIRVVVGAWCSRNEVSETAFHQARVAIERWIFDKPASAMEGN